MTAPTSGMDRHFTAPFHRQIPAWLPNAISFGRIALVPVWLALAIDTRTRALAGASASAVGALVVLVAIGVSDLLDGMLARRFQLASNLGATLDAVADKCAQISTVTFLVWWGDPPFTSLPLALMVVLATRDALLAVGWLAVRRSRGTVTVEHRWHGKVSSALLFFVILAALAGAPRVAVDLGAAAVVLLVIPSTVTYLRAGWRQLRPVPARSQAARHS